MQHFPDHHGPDGEAADLRSRGEALQQAAALPDAELRPLLEAALAELDGAVSALAAAEGSAGGRKSEPGPEAVHSERRLLHAVFQQAPLPLFVLGRDGVIRRANAAADSLLGAGPGYATGKVFTALIDPPSRAAVDSQLAAVARTGQGCQLRCNVLGTGGAAGCELAVRLVRVRGDHDRLLVAVGGRADRPAASSASTGTDGSTAARAEPVPQRRADAGLERAASASVMATMTRRLDTVTGINRLLLENVAASEAVILQRCARLMAGELAAWVIVDMEREGRLQRHFIAGPEDRDVVTQAAAAAAVDPAPDSAPGQVYASGSSLLLAHAEDAGVLGTGSDGVPLLMLLRGASVLCVPLTGGGGTHGVLTLVRDIHEGNFGLADVGLAEEIAEQIARAVTVHRMIQSRTEAAEALQGSLLPRELKPVPGVEIAASHLPPTRGREVGGDFYDVYPTPAGWGLAIGDVVGKGQDAAAVTAAARHAIRVLAHWNADPAEVLRDANDIMLAEQFGSRFVTADAAHLQWQDGSLRVVLASAGHPGPVRLTPDGRAQQVPGGGVPLGIFADAQPATQELVLAPGDVLFFFTDGLTGAHNADLGYFENHITDGLASLAGKSSADVISGMRKLLLDFCDGVLLDDMTMLAVRAGEPPEARSARKRRT
jgi:serine phosphatase RsbU (regulator of sigma subunit)/PAS domain-containing protein